MKWNRLEQHKNWSRLQTYVQWYIPYKFSGENMFGITCIFPFAHYHASRAKNAQNSSRQLRSESCSELKQKCQASNSNEQKDNGMATETNGEFGTPTNFLLWFFPLHCAILVLHKIKSWPKCIFQLAARSIAKNGYIAMTPVETSWIFSLWDSVLVKNSLFYLFERLKLKSAI